MKAVDEALTQLRALARDGASQVDMVTVYVHRDGRVDIFASGGAITRWRVSADLEPGGALPLPSAALDGPRR